MLREVFGAYTNMKVHSSHSKKAAQRILSNCTTFTRTKKVHITDLVHRVSPVNEQLLIRFQQEQEEV